MNYKLKGYQKYLEEGENIERVIHHNYDEIVEPLSSIIILFIALPILGLLFTEHLSFLWLAILSVGIFKSLKLLLFWYFNCLLVTNLNLVDIKWKHLFEKASERIDYSQVESFSYEISGILNTLFNIGDIHITKLSGEEYLLKGIHKPQYFCNLLNKIQLDKAKQEIYKDHSQLKEVLTKVVQSHIAEHGIRVVNDEA